MDRTRVSLNINSEMNSSMGIIIIASQGPKVYTRAIIAYMYGVRGFSPVKLI